LKNKRVELGDIYVGPAGGNLKCKYIIHAACKEKFKERSSQECINSVISKALQEVDKRELQTISIPCIVKTSAGFAIPYAIPLVFQAIEEFVLKNSNFF
jgi:O-acetyl-ADP-ribose deacetylase (regulator of RNase III)